MYFAIRVYDDENRQNKSRDKVILLANENQARLVTTNQRPTEEIFAEVSIWKKQSNFRHEGMSHYICIILYSKILTMVTQICLFNSYSCKRHGLEQLDINRISFDCLKFKNNFLNFVWRLFWTRRKMSPVIQPIRHIILNSNDTALDRLIFAVSGVFCNHRYPW